MTVHRDEVWAGVLVVIALGVLTVGMLALAGSANLFRSTRTVVAVFADARGVREGDPVRFAGLKVGEVAQLDIRPGSEGIASLIAATLTVPGDLEVPVDSAVRVTESLTGSRIVEITPGTGEPMGPDDELADLDPPPGLDDLALSMDGLAKVATAAIDDAGELIDRLGKVVERIDDAMSGERLTSILDNLEVSSKDIAKASRDLSEMLAETRPRIAEAAESIRKAGAEASAMIEETRPEVKAILARVEAAADGVAALLEGPEAPVAQTVARITEAATRLEQVLDGFGETGRQAAELIASSRPRVESILDRLRTTGTNLEAASEDLRAHPWKLLNEPEVEDQRVQMIFNAARNFNSGAAALGEATRELRAALDRGGAAPGDVEKLLERLDRSFARFERVESLFWEALRAGQK